MASAAKECDRYTPQGSPVAPPTGYTCSVGEQTFTHDL